MSMTSRAGVAAGDSVSEAPRWLARGPYTDTAEEPEDEIFLRNDPAIASPKSLSRQLRGQRGTLVIGRFLAEFNPFLRALPG